MAAGYPAEQQMHDERQTSFPFKMDTREMPVAVIGAGFLGSKIITEFFLLGVQVQVYDMDIARMGQEQGQKELEARVQSCLEESNSRGVLQAAGLHLDVLLRQTVLRKVPSPFENRPDEPSGGIPLAPPVFFASVGKAAQGCSMVIECVPDRLSIKADVFTEAAQHAPPNVLLATSTITVPLGKIQEKVEQHLADPANLEFGAKAPTQTPRVVGLRFLAPVVLIPFAELTLTDEQYRGQVRKDLMFLMNFWGKSAFLCEVEGAVSGLNDDDEGREIAYNLGCARLRLNPRDSHKRQLAEARLRREQRKGKEAVAALTPGQLFGFDGGEEKCCICLDAAPSVTSAVCGHTALCSECAERLVSLQGEQRRCPLCREYFLKAV